MEATTILTRGETQIPMQCPACTELNTATSVRCVRCGTTLIYEAIGHSVGYRDATSKLDARVYSGIGAFFGFFLVAVLLKVVLPGLWLSDREIYGAAIGGAVVGGIVGRLFLRFKKEGL